MAAKSIGSCPYAAMASTCSGTPTRAAAAEISVIGCTVPTSLLAMSTVTRAMSDGSSASARSSSGILSRPNSSSGSHSITAPSWAASHSTVSIVAWCSPPATRMRCPGRAQKSPLMPRLTASVPPPVKTTSIASQPSVAATCSRASSSIRLAFCPTEWIDAGFPTTLIACVYAEMATGSIGVVAA